MNIRRIIAKQLLKMNRGFDAVIWCIYPEISKSSLKIMPEPDRGKVRVKFYMDILDDGNGEPPCLADSAMTYAEWCRVIRLVQRVFDVHEPPSGEGNA